jgi:hypothetical protein
MKRYSSTASLALAVVVVLGLNGPGAARERGERGEQVPFKGSYEGDVTVTPLTPPFIHVDVEAEGNATHLGRFTLDIPHKVNLSNSTAVGSYEFTAANGDMVFADFTGQATPTSTPGVVSIVETATITGGTGRFAGASGGFTSERLYDRVQGTTIGSFEGTIHLRDDDDGDDRDDD